MVAEVPEAFTEASRLFEASGYVQEALLTDYVREPGGSESGACPERAPQSGASRWVIPVTVDDLAANGLLGDEYPKTCWERSVETLIARKEEITGLAVASEERIEAYVLYIKGGEILSLRTLVEDSGARLRQLLGRLDVAGNGAFRLPKVHPAEISKEILESLGFRPAAEHLLYAARARSE